MLQRWMEHTESWQQETSGIHYVAYEDLYTRLDETLNKIAAVLEQPVITQTRPPLDAPSSLPWKGIAGTWKEFFTEADEHYFKLHTGKRN